MSLCCKITVNGTEHEFPEDRKLMDVLRNDLHLKSVKNGCSEGACGSCTVLIDGKPVKSCVQTVGRAAGKNILTVEGLSEREKDVFVWAFAEAGAVQCGFCIPGMVLCAKALILKNPDPSRPEAVMAIRNNICRCTGYKKIIDGILLSAKMLRENTPVPEEEKHVKPGSRMHRIDAAEKVLGTGKYADDIEIEGMVFAAAVRPAFPREKVIAIHTEEAEKLPGVLRVFTSKDVPGSNRVGHIVRDWDAFIPEGECTRYLGDVIALVVAENEEVLAKARTLVKVDAEELPPVTCPEEALKPGAPKLHENGNIVSHEHLMKNDAVSVIEKSAHRVTKTYHTPWTEHAFLEPECAVALPFDGGVYVYSSDQGTYDTRRECSYLLGLPAEKIIVENALVGGGFGGKEDMTVQHYAAMAAFLTGRAVKMRLTRKESIIVHPKRHEMTIDLTTACDENGKLTAMKAVIVSDNGAYASLGGPVLQRACTHAAGPYNYQSIDIEGTAVYTDNPPAGAFRGFGVPQTCFATERNIDLLAEMVGLDPWQIRYLNAIRPGEVLPNGQIAGAETGLTETLDAVKEQFYGNRYVGIACAFKNSGVGVGLQDWGRVRLKIEEGKVHIQSGASCIGQGVGTVLVQLVCGECGLTTDEVVWHRPNTKDAPDSGTTSGSRQTLITGEACKRACAELKKELDFHNGSLAALEGKEFYGEYLAKTDKLGADKQNPVSHVAYGYATQLCILNDDGTVKKIVAAHDVGKAVNPVALEGQIEGGCVMSAGYALTERYPLNKCVPEAKFGTLGLFRADRVPEVEPLIIEKPGLSIGEGAIGIGEISSIPTAPAIAGAYYSYSGEYETDLPLKNTPYARK